MNGVSTKNAQVAGDKLFLAGVPKAYARNCGRPGSLKLQDLSVKQDVQIGMLGDVV